MAECSENSEDKAKLFDEFKAKIAEAKLSTSMDKILIERYLKVSDYKLDEAFELLKHGLELRTKAPYLFTDRDLSSKDIETACTCFQFCPLKKLTKDKYKVTIIRFHKCDSSIYDSVQVIKTALMMFDANYVSYDDGDELCEGEIFVLDVCGFSFKQFLNLSGNVKTLLHYTQFLQEAAPVKLNCNHITNMSSIMDGVMMLLKPILSKEVNDVVHFHKVGSETMLKHIEADVLPIEYGGTNGSIDEHYKSWLEIFKTKRDYLLNDNNWLVPASSPDSA